tara:strand:+ start:5048 stop:5596 length:549 start_codon:yes stop_codon:yes gene_type:complete
LFIKKDMIYKVKINEVFGNPVNPRTIKENKFKKLVKSIEEFPEMLKLRPIVVNKEMGIIGGNMRFKACQSLKHKEIYIIKAENLSEKQIEQFIIKDNVGFGEWDWDMLGNAWDSFELENWGLDVINFPENYGEEELLQDADFTEKKEVIISLTMPFYEYSKIENEFQKFIKKYPNIVCQIRN